MPKDAIDVVSDDVEEKKLREATSNVNIIDRRSGTWTGIRVRPVLKSICADLSCRIGVTRSRESETQAYHMKNVLRIGRESKLVVYIW